jgi:hypothetical protein
MTRPFRGTMTSPNFLLRGGYEKGDGSMDGAQLVDGEWWHPIFGCDSLQLVIDRALSPPPTHPLVGTYGWPRGLKETDRDPTKVHLLRVDSVFNNYRVKGLTSDGYEFATSVGVWKRENYPATHSEWVVATQTAQKLSTTE